MKTTYQSQNPADTRKSLQVVQSMMTDDSMRIWYEPKENEENRILVQHYNPENADDIVNQIQCDKSGVYHHVKENGSWRTVPHSIAVGGTGATNRRLAAANLGLEAVNEQVMESNNVPIMGYVTENATRLVLNFPTHVHTYGITRIVINTLTGVLRGNNGYLDNINTVRNLLASPFTSTIQKRHTGLFVVTVTKNAAFTNVTNNTPVCCMINYKFTMYDS